MSPLSPTTVDPCDCICDVVPKCSRSGGQPRKSLTVDSQETAETAARFAHTVMKDRHGCFHDVRRAKKAFLCPLTLMLCKASAVDRG